MLSLLILFDILENILTWPSLIDREPNVKMQFLLILKKRKKKKNRADLISRIDYRWILREDLIAKITKICLKEYTKA